MSPLHEGSVLPVDEFQVILDGYRSISPDQIVLKSKATLVVRESLSTLERIIELLVTTGGTNAHYRKAVSCVKVFISVSIAYSLLPRSCEWVLSKLENMIGTTNICEK